MKNAPPREYLTPNQLAARLGVKRETVVAWIRSGELRAFNAARSTDVPARYRISEQAIREFEERRSGAATKLPVRTRRTRRERPADWIEYF